MFDALRKLFSAEKTEDEADGIPPRTAAAALLVEIALADGVYAGVEADQIKTCLKQAFSLSDAEAAVMMEKAESLAENAVDHHRFTQSVKFGLPKEERLTLMENMWRVVLADGEREAHEDMMLRRLAPLLGLTDRERAEARQRAAG
ncbi:MAG: TerB family tellurite resistance protein [Pseudomonadota bacterium]